MIFTCHCSSGTLLRERTRRRRCPCNCRMAGSPPRTPAPAAPTTPTRPLARPAGSCLRMRTYCAREHVTCHCVSVSTRCRCGTATVARLTQFNRTRSSSASWPDCPTHGSTLGFLLLQRPDARRRRRRAAPGLDCSHGSIQWPHLLRKHRDQGHVVGGSHGRGTRAGACARGSSPCPGTCACACGCSGNRITRSSGGTRGCTFATWKMRGC